LQAQKLKKLGIEFESTSYNFGDIQMWENQPAIFQLKNNSKHLISILPLFSENDLEIVYPDKSIAPGESVVIKAIYYTSGTGSFSRKFPIYFSTSPEAYELKITGNIKSLSPTAYIQCPQAKPEHSKPKLELVGNVAEIESEIPLSGSVIKITALSSKGNTTFYADQNGNFGSKMPTGNYEVIAEHPNYKPHSSFFFLGQSTGYLKIRLEPIEQEILALNPPTKISVPVSNIRTKEGSKQNQTESKPVNKVLVAETVKVIPQASLAQEEVTSKQVELNERLNNDAPNKVHVKTTEINPAQEIIIEKQGIYVKQELIISKEPVKEITPEATTQKEQTFQVKQQAIVQKEQPKESAQLIQTPVPFTPTLKQYTVRVLDEKTLEPIDEAQLYITAVLDKKQTQKIKSDGSGLATFSLSGEDYKIIVNADNYISGEAKIKSGQDDAIIRIYLSRVSNLFEDIYEAKKAEKHPEELLSQFYFGKSEFSFDKPKEVINEPVAILETTTPSGASKLEEEILAETTPEIIQNKSTLPDEVEASPIVEKTQLKDPINIDSIQQYYGAIQAEKEAMELELQEVKNKLDSQDELLAIKEEELKKKESALSSTTDELDAVKTQYNSTEKELEAKNEALKNLEQAKEEVIEEAPMNYELSKNEYAANNVLFLIDVSSSMGKENKMELLKESIKSLTIVLRDIDRVAIIAYNQKTSVILESVNGNNKGLILRAIDSLETSGLTYGVNGLQTAYELLQYYYIGDGNNQIILATDGLFSSANATMTENELNKEVRQQASDNNIKLSVVGFGQDDEGAKLMQKLANNGQGQFIQIKNPWEAKTVLVEEIKLNSKL
jgi:Mg-chelatase subunit ChlD